MYAAEKIDTYFSSVTLALKMRRPLKSVSSILLIAKFLIFVI